MSTLGRTSSVSDYDDAYYLRRQATPTLAAEIDAVTELLHARPCDSILEVGCGGGALLSRLADLGARQVVGLDWQRTSVDLTRRRDLRAEMLRGDARTLPFPDQHFDKVVAQHLIEHFADSEAVLSEWRRVLRAKGSLIIVTPNLAFPHQEWFEDPTHRHIFSESDLRLRLRRVGFQVNETRIINPYVGSLTLQFAAARHLQFLRRIPWIGGRGMSLVALASRS